ncbi:MAG: MAPEG family protein [Pseudomonadota bacterium]
MGHTAIFLPVMALVGWTFVVLLTIPFRRFRAAFKGEVTAADFRNGESRRVPLEVSLANRNFMNLLEAPVLFYVVCFIYYLTNAPIASFVTLAWIFVGLRVVHSLIHLIYNNVMHRLVAYAASNVVLIVLWLLLLRTLLQAT